MLPADIKLYNENLSPVNQEIALTLSNDIATYLPEAIGKVWHGHPVWFIEDNPIAGYSLLKSGMRLLFWSGQSFQHPGLSPEGKFKAADVLFSDAAQINRSDLAAWLSEARTVQWDYKNLAKRKGTLLRLS